MYLPWCCIVFNADDSKVKEFGLEALYEEGLSSKPGGNINPFYRINTDMSHLATDQSVPLMQHRLTVNE